MTISDHAFPRRVLVVDDDEIVRTILVGMIERIGCQAVSVTNASDAISEIETRRPDVIITDIYMPDSDGFELINWARETDAGIPLVAMSGTSGVLGDQLSLAIRLGAGAVLSKPFSEASIKAAIEAAMANAGT